MNTDQTLKDQYFNELSLGIRKMKEYPSKDILLLHHNDTDGLTSGAILLKALTRAGYNIKRYSLEKPYPKILEKLLNENEKKVIVFADFAGGIAPTIANLNSGKNLVLILDHHKAKRTDDPFVLNLNPDFFGLKGDRDISASVVCYHFSFILDTINRDLVHIAAFGGIADFYYRDHQIHSFNLECFQEASKLGLMRKEKKLLTEKYYIRLGNQEVDVVSFYPMIDIAGGVGYYGKGPEVAIDVLLNGITDENISFIENLKNIKQKIFSKEIENIKKGGLIVGKNIQWFNAKMNLKPMGVKMVGILCNEIAEMDFIDQNKYIAGYQQIPNEIPNFGKIMMNQTKLSMRTTEKLSKKILNKEMPGLDTFLPQATLNLGGFADACHSIAAAVTIEIGKEKELMKEAEKLLQNEILKLKSIE
ncbi:MAG: DHH family phosphoesterase [Candidatus Atribacteria bacterium]|nr:DHH family phosphoesterase [Candidatus Atribacteria bacterium]